MAKAGGGQHQRAGLDESAASGCSLQGLSEGLLFDELELKSDSIVVVVPIVINAVKYAWSRSRL